MRLSDIMGNMDLTVYPILALVIFSGVFVLVTGRALRTDRATHARWARIPLDPEVKVGERAEPAKEAKL